MTTVTDVSSKLGEYMLKGWVLTDITCSKPGCRIPLMRSPNGTTPPTYFCANCDDGPQSQNPLSMTTPTSASDAITQASSLSSRSEHARSSTPPTELTSALSSPTFAPGVESEETLHRRQQSDFASAEIGKRLLKGWAMLADECPNIRCYGVPLVRPPRTGGDRPGLKECVVCGTAYANETDDQGWERLVPVNASTSQGAQRQAQATASAAHILNETGASSDPRVSRPLLNVETQGARTTTSSLVLHHPTARYEPQVSSPSTTSALNTSARSLETMLKALSRKLITQSSDPAMLDPTSVSATVDAITKTTQALAAVKKLLRSEYQAGAQL